MCTKNSEGKECLRPFFKPSLSTHTGQGKDTPREGQCASGGFGLVPYRPSEHHPSLLSTRSAARITPCEWDSEGRTPRAHGELGLQSKQSLWL